MPRIKIPTIEDVIWQEKKGMLSNKDLAMANRLSKTNSPLFMSENKNSKAYEM